MKKFFFLCIFLSLFNTTHAYEWRDAWVNAVRLCHEKSYLEAEKNFDLSIGLLEEVGEECYPHVYVDRARLYSLLEKHEESLQDVDKALLSSFLTDSDRLRAIVTRITALANLGRTEEMMVEVENYKSIYPNLPKSEFSKETIIIRNMPECDCYKNIIKNYLIYSGYCESDKDIQMFPSGICIAKVKKCNCKDKEQDKQEKEKACKYWCDKMAIAGTVWCSKTFKRWDCQGACIIAVDFIKDGCHWCCKEGDFYKRCVKPFEDIVKYMDPPCDPEWD